MESATHSDCLTINAGSSSIKFSLYPPQAGDGAVFAGSINGIGGVHASFSVHGALAADTFAWGFPMPEQVTAVNVLVDWLTERVNPVTLHSVTYRIVHGGPECCATAPITTAMLAARYAVHRPGPAAAGYQPDRDPAPALSASCPCGLFRQPLPRQHGARAEHVADSPPLRCARRSPTTSTDTP